jgi:hypothetical protein
MIIAALVIIIVLLVVIASLHFVQLAAIAQLWIANGAPGPLRPMWRSKPRPTPPAAEPEPEVFASRKPWHIRRRELEAASRTRRAKIESFKE